MRPFFCRVKVMLLGLSAIADKKRKERESKNRRSEQGVIFG